VAWVGRGSNSATKRDVNQLQHYTACLQSSGKHAARSSWSRTIFTFKFQSFLPRVVVVVHKMTHQHTIYVVAITTTVHRGLGPS
jgi:hypothetical protein